VIAEQNRASVTVPVAAVILTYSEEVNIEPCLRSIAGWCREIFVVDSGSTDRTLEICRQYTGRICTHPYTDHASQLAWALANLPFSCEWIMPLDADHVITDRLRQEIIDVLRNPEPDVDGYYSRHQYFFWGVPIRGFKPYTLRLFRLHKTRLDHSELVDFRFVVEGKTRKLSGAVYENNNKESSIDFWIDKHQKFSSRIAVEEVLRASGCVNWSIRPRLLGNPDERIIWLKNRWYRLPLYFRPFIYFLYRYLFRLGFLDGKTGFVYHFLQAFWFRLLVDIKIAELRRQLSAGELSLDQLRASFEHQF
jgi:glycosyltransferase involved in cell wall biosynthesis